MKTLAIAFALLSLSAVAASADTCVANADAKKLAGAARTSFLTKCQKDAATACNTQAADKKLHHQVREGCRRAVKPLAGQLAGWAAGSPGLAMGQRRCSGAG